MSISASTLAQSLHSTLHRSGTQQSAPMQRREQFEQHLRSASNQPGQGAGSLLSGDMLKAMQTLGTAS